MMAGSWEGGIKLTRRCVCEQMQFQNNQFMTLCEGMIKFNVNLFLHLLFKKFYRDAS